MSNYALSWGTNHPAILIYLVDFSGSMAAFDKITRVSQTIWHVSEFLLSQCQDGNDYKNRFELHVIGYNQYTYNVFNGTPAQINELLDKTYNNNQPNESKFFEPVGENKPQGLTHMAMAFDKASEIINTWISKQRAAGLQTPAPVVINLTDGYPEEKGLSDEESAQKALDAANRLKSISVPDGNVLLFNIHIDGKPGTVKPMVFPSSCPTDARRSLLFNASTSMTDIFIKRANQFGFQAQAGSRFMVSNQSDYNTLARLIAFGSSVSSHGNDVHEIPIP